MSTFKIIIQETSPTGEDGAPETIDIYTQRFTEINLSAIIKAINLTPRKRGPKAKTEGAK